MKRRIVGDCLKCRRKVYTIVEEGRAPYVEHDGKSCEPADVEIVGSPPDDAKSADAERRLVITAAGGVEIDLAEFGLGVDDVDLDD